MSAAPAKTADPSMEEILASIRRIIADDDEAKPAANAPEAAIESVPAQSEALTADDPSRVVAEDDDGVLDLAKAPDAKPAMRASLEIEVPDIQFEEAAQAPSAPIAPPVFARAPEKAAPPPVEPSAPRVEPAAPSAETLISTEATHSVGHAFNLLSHTIMSQNAHTLEDIVREMLRPMLKTWLDDNLPPLVERLVAAEIERVARGRR